MNPTPCDRPFNLSGRVIISPLIIPAIVPVIGANITPAIEERDGLGCMPTVWDLVRSGGPIGRIEISRRSYGSV